MRAFGTPVLAASLWLLACTSPPPEPPADVPANRENARPVAATREVPVEPSPPQEEPPRPAPTLRTVLESHGTLSRIGERPAFGPHDAGFRRLPAIVFGQDGQIEERIQLPVRDGTFAVGGHWPTPMFVQGAWGDRGAPDNPFIVVRFGETWKDSRYVKRGYHSNQFVFPWRETSLLALSNPDYDLNGPPRMGVIAGAPTAPKLWPVLVESNCRVSEVASMAVDPRGPVGLSLHCRNRNRWLVYWKGDGSAAERRQLPERSSDSDSDEIQPALGPDGSVLFAYLDRDSVQIQRREDGQWRTSSLPGTAAPVQAAITEHDTWVLTTDAIHRETKDGWGNVEAPSEGPFRLFAGLETGSPWLVGEGQQLWWKNERGVWMDIALPDSPFASGAYTSVTEILSLGRGEAWIEARMDPGKYRIRDRHAHAILTTGSAPEPKLGACNDRGPAAGIRCDYLTWPKVDQACSKQLALLVDRGTGAASGNYRPLRKRLKASRLEGAPPTFVEAEIGHIKVLAAWVESYEQGLALLERAPWRNPAYPRPVCGDEASLAASDLVLGEMVELQAPSR